VPRPDNPASGGRRRCCVAAARHKPDLVAQLVSESRLEPNIPTELGLIAQADLVANRESGAQSKAIPGAEPDTPAESDSVVLDD
jgi:hypothetical protein